MDTRTGEIKMYAPGEKVPPGNIELLNLPNPNCPICKGKGKVGPKFVGNKHRRQIVYLPCKCTNPVKGPELKSLEAMEKAGELTDVPLAMPNPDESKAIADAVARSETTAILIDPPKSV